MSNIKKGPPRGLIGPRIGCISKQMRTKFNEVVQEEGLFSGQEDIILILSEHESLTISEIAKITGVTPATTSVSIDRLRKNGFVIKEQDKHDSRKTIIKLTEKGNSIPERIRQKMDVFDDQVTKGFSEKEKLLLSDMLDRIKNNLKGEEHNEKNL